MKVTLDNVSLFPEGVCVVQVYFYAKAVDVLMDCLSGQSLAEASVS